MTVPLTIATTALPPAETGEHLSVALLATGGTPPYTWEPVVLPPGLTLSRGGVLGGTPSATGSQEVDVTVVDATDTRVSAAFVLSVGAGPVVTAMTLPQGQVGQPYSVTLAATGGTAPYTWIVPHGGIPGGLVLASSGVLSGRPGRAGRYRIDLGVSDALGAVGRLGFTLVVLPPLPPPPPLQGYVTVDAAGRTDSVGLVAASSRARLGGSTVAVAVEPSGAGYWTVNSVGTVHAFGAAPFHGSVGRRYLDAPIVGIAARPGGAGYWVASATGHVYGFGADRTLGSVPAHELRGTIVGIAAADHGRGYWLASSTGQVFAFGTARSAGIGRVTRFPGGIVAIAAATVSDGFYVVSATGRVQGAGGAGPAPARSGRVVGRVVGIAVPPAAAGPGYWLLSQTGAVYAFGAAVVETTGAPPPAGTVPVVPPRGIAGAR
ncbi:MAG TPA: Ig domain-containing protein [Acidimicrobiales bacterium]|nr:Ig domain-containing protein [Acidimicrobiales bacterium]